MTRLRLLPVVALAAFVPLRASALSCSITGVTPLSFGAYNVFDTNDVDTTGGVTVHCTSVVPADTIEVELSAGDAASYAPRRLARAGGQTLAYNIYTDPSNTTVWGDGTNGTAVYGPVTPPDGTDLDITAYGTIPAEQDVAAGSYTDTIVVTLNY